MTRNTSTPAAPPTRKLRADAQRNRERILEVAKEAFKRDGAETSLDDIARNAEVGSGTLYRHFPTREALIEAVYYSEVEKLTNAADRLADQLPPLEALRTWMHVFVDHVAQKTLIIPAMDTVEGGAMRLIGGSRERTHGAFARAIQRAIDSGELRADTEPGDLIRAFVGVFHTTAVPGWEASARRLIDILIAGTRA
ncbi:MAG: TetR/AcrR family transcriptional regulator [Acidobacteriaceae bacterium]|nr:TetR/AcrR family transcriptional regulator [Acidobacteriaceae bacterium]